METSFAHPKPGHGGSQHEAFFWSQTRQAYLAERSEKDRKKEEKDKFLQGLSDTASANLLLSKTKSWESDLSVKTLLAHALTSQKSVGTLEASLKEKETENCSLREEILRLNREIDKIKGDSNGSVGESTVQE